MTETVEYRVARLEADVANILISVSDIKQDIRALRQITNSPVREIRAEIDILRRDVLREIGKVRDKMG